MSASGHRDAEAATPSWTKHAGEGEAQRLDREAAVLAELDGAGVVELEASGDGWISTRMAGRRTLAELAEGRGIEPDVGLAALAALDELHAAGWSHGSATLDHAVVAANGRVRWCSLAGARRIEGPTDPVARRERTAVEQFLAEALPRGHRRRPRPPHARRKSSRPAVVRHRRRARRSLGAAAAFGLIACGAFVAYKALGGRDDPLDRAAHLAALVTGLLALYGMIANSLLAVAWAGRRGDLAQRVGAALPRWLAWLVVGSTGMTATTAALATALPAGNGVEMPAPAPTTSATSATTTAPMRAPTSAPSSTVASSVPDQVPIPTAPDPTAPPPAAQPTPEAIEVVAGKGDHLWGIAEEALARHLDRPPSKAEVAPYWRRLVDANRSRLVDPSNPDLIFVGQRFVLPPM